MPRKPVAKGVVPTHVQNIRRILRERNWTQLEFSEKVKLSKQSVYAALSGGDIRLSTLLRMARTLEVEPYELLMPESAAVQRRSEMAPAINPLLALLTNLLGAAAQPQIPTAAQEFLSVWSRLDSRDMSALMSLAKTLAGNKATNANLKTAANEK